ncbi:GerAB/ArcD/ProY family transporter [Virgibacillus flavescens]|uniref:GerAB/ArcD/ProY family transporter n=1 Tax=Virgibacillus flavescens TaxID=1611422 RepID=UPI003D355CAD
MKKITPNQLFFVVLQTQIGVGILSLPYSLYVVAKQDSWISLIIAGIFIQVFIFVIWKLGTRFPERTVFEICDILLGKFLGKIISVFYICYFIAVSSLILVLFSLLIRIWILPQTPFWIVILLMVVTGVYIVLSDLRVIARFFTVVSVFYLVLLFLMIAVLFNGFNYTYIFPIGGAGILAIVKGAREGLLALLGFEILLVLFPYVQGGSIKKLKKISIANIVIFLFYLFIVVVCLLLFSPAELKFIPEPVLYALKTLDFKVLSRLDLLFLSIWVISVATSYMMYLFLANHGVQKITKKKWKYSAYFIGLISFTVSMIPGENLLIIQQYSKIVTQSGFVFAMGLPVILLLISLLFRKKEEPSNYEED